MSHRALILALLPVADLRLPAPSGPHRVGTEVFALELQGRADPADASRPRQLLVQLWYPAEPSSAQELAPYLYEVELFEALEHEHYLDLDTDTLGAWADLSTHAHLGAALLGSATPAAEATADLPLVLFSPGLGMARCSYTTLVEALASNGFVVAAIDHPYLGLCALADGRVLTTDQIDFSEQEVPAYVGEMARDAQQLLERLLDRDGPFARFAARIDARRVGVFGHSLGGAMALELGRIDARFRACIDMDGSPFGAVETEGTARPALVLLNQPEASKRPPLAMKEERHNQWVSVFSHHDSTAFLATIENTNHFSFSDLPFLVAPERMARTGATLAAERNLALITRLLTGFLRTELELPTGETIEQAAAACPEVALERLRGLEGSSTRPEQTRAALSRGRKTGPSVQGVVTNSSCAAPGKVPVAGSHTRCRARAAVRPR